MDEFTGKHAHERVSERRKLSIRFWPGHIWVELAV
jgi:hypothetical protein